LTWIFGQLTFFQFWTPDILRSWGVGTPNGSLWTITVELQFYIILPILVLYLKKLKLIYKILTLSITLTFVNYYLSIDYGFNESIIDKLIGVSFIPYLNFFLSGVIIYVFWVKIKKFFEGKAFIWLFVYLFFSYFYDLKPSYHPSGLQFISNFLLSILTISAAFTFPKISKFLNGNDISYGLYIYHMLVINTMIHLGFSKRFEYLLITILITTILSILSWILIEKKALSLKNKF
jgi:peptidoglycan/LPS O-acetylase OafA/YrhL